MEPDIGTLDPSIENDLGSSAEPKAEQQADLERAIAEDRDEEEREAADPDNSEERVRAERDVGELYGVHTPPSGDTHIANESQDYEGRNWLEALETVSAESGPEPEHVIDVIDETDIDAPGHSKSDTRDRPVADKGCGPGGEPGCG